MFVGRSAELKVLEDAYSSDTFEFIVMYGRRRVGKTTVLNQFAKDKQPVFVTGIESDAGVNLANIGKSITSTYPELPPSTFGSFHAALEYLFKRSEREKILLIIDEYPYIARADKSVPSLLQALIDEHRNRCHMKLIICGSSMSFMEDEVLSYKAPLYGRRTGQLLLHPFEFAEARQFIPRMHPDDQLTAYAATGGIPSYLERFDDTQSLRENIIRNFLTPQSPMYTDPTPLLREELREPAGYNAILSAIAEGASRFSQIASKVNMSSAATDAHLRRLMELELVARRVPFGDPSKRKTIYRISDGSFRFYYRFVQPNTTRVQRGLSTQAFDEIEEQLSDFTSKAFEEVSMQYLWQLLATGRSPVHFRDLGAWWGTNAATRAAEEIDIVGTDASSILTAECKWRKDPVDATVLQKLRERTALISRGRRPYLHVFSRSGFTNGVQDAARGDSSVSLATYAEMIREFDQMT